MLSNKNKPKDELYWLKVSVIIFLVCVAFLFLYLYQTKTITPPAPSPTPTPFPVSSENITVYAPAADERISTEFIVRGKARVFESTVSIRVKNKITDRVYLQTIAQTNAKDMGVFGDFYLVAQLQPDMSLKAGDPLLLEVFQLSAKDGSEMDKVTLPLKFTPM